MNMKITTGAEIKEVGSTIKSKTGGWRIKRPSIDNKRCVQCNSCWIFCPDNSIYIENGEYKVNLDFCKGCGICANECPTGAIVMVLEEK